MKPYILSLAVGVLVGVVYALLKVRSPAPPVIALVGLLGMLAGEQVPALVKQLIHRDGERTTWLRGHVRSDASGLRGHVRSDASGQSPQGSATKHDTTAAERKA